MNTTNTISQAKKPDANKSNSHTKETNDLKMPTLDQFMELIKDEGNALNTGNSPSAYNAYRKYNKGS